MPISRLPMAGIFRGETGRSVFLPYPIYANRKMPFYELHKNQAKFMQIIKSSTRDVQI